MFKAAMSITTEQILPIYARARIPTLQANKIAQDIVQHYRNMQNLMRSKKGEIGRAKARVEAFKKRLHKTWPAGGKMYGAGYPTQKTNHFLHQCRMIALHQ